MNDRLGFLRDKSNKLSLSPGVYLMKDKTGRIIYVGKAKALKNRVTTYFHALESHNAKTRKLVENIYDFDFIVTPSELDALVLECSLIKQYNPKYNILLKDDKGYNYIKSQKSHIRELLMRSTATTKMRSILVRSRADLPQSKRSMRSTGFLCSRPVTRSFREISEKSVHALIII